MLLGGNLPDFLNADTVVLWVLAFIQAETADQLFAQVASAAFGEQRVAGVQLHAGRIAVLFLAIRAYPHIAGGNTLDPAIVVVQHLGSGKPRVDLNAQVLGLLRQPAADVAHGNDEVAFVVGGLGNQEIRQLDGFLGARVKEEVVVRDRGVQRCTHVGPVGKQLRQRAWFEHGTGQNVCAHLGTFLDDANRDFPFLRLGQLHDATGGRQARGPRANNHYIKFH